MTEENVRRMREHLWAGYIITQENIEDGLIPIEHLEGSPEWRFCPDTRNWYNDSRIVELCVQKAEQHQAKLLAHGEPLKVPMREKPELIGKNIIESGHNRPGYEPDDFSTANMTVRSYEHQPALESLPRTWRTIDRIEPLPYEEPSKWLQDQLIAINEAWAKGPPYEFLRLEETHDQNSMMGDLLAQHAAQLRYWDKGTDADKIVADLAEVGITVKATIWEPPIPERNSGFLCTNCGQDRGVGAVCESCNEYTSLCHIVDGRVVE
jgi:hypothetical protein